jgi:hypothetical protein
MFFAINFSQFPYLFYQFPFFLFSIPFLLLFCINEESTQFPLRIEGAVDQIIFFYNFISLQLM